MDPDERMISALAQTSRTTSPCRNTTPTTRPSSTTRRWASAWVSTRRFGPAVRLAQIGPRGALPATIADGMLKIAHTFLLAVIVVVVARDAGLYAGLHEELRQGVLLYGVDDVDRAAPAANLRVAARPVLELS